MIAPRHHQLFAGKEIGQCGRIDLIGHEVTGRSRGKFNRDITEHGGADPIVEMADLFVNALFWAHVAAAAAEITAQRVKQGCVDIITKAKSKEAQGECGRLIRHHIRQNAVDLPFALGWQAISKEEDIGRPCAISCKLG